MIKELFRWFGDILWFCFKLISLFSAIIFVGSLLPEVYMKIDAALPGTIGVIHYMLVFAPIGMALSMIGWGCYAVWKIVKSFSKAMNK